jgi:hypothetical protein
MYITTRSIAGNTLMTCSDCGHAISMNKICETPFQSATGMLKHMAAHNASRPVAATWRVTRPDPEAVPLIELVAAAAVLDGNWVNAQWNTPSKSN